MKEKLFADFNTISTQEWEEKIHLDLKGASYDKKLIWNTEEGFALKPYYRAENIENLDFTNHIPGQYPYVRGYNQKANQCVLRQEVDVVSAQKANHYIKKNLLKDVFSFALHIDKNVEVSEEFFHILFDEINIKEVEWNFVPASNTVYFAKELSTYLQKNTLSDIFRGSVHYDPLQILISNPNQKIDIAKDCKKLFVSTSDSKDLRFLMIEGKFLKNSGATIVQELAYTLSQAVEYLDVLTENGFRADEIVPKMKFNFAVGGDYFMEIAKLRAFRWLWSLICHEYEIDNGIIKQTYIHSETAIWNKSLYDSYLNLLRTTTESMATILGGADSLCVLPFNVVRDKYDDFAERIARNQYHLLKEESYLGDVKDAASGSYLIENLTSSLVQHVFELFKYVESQGGFSEALKKGVIQKEVEKSSAEKFKKIAERRINILGVNQFPDFNEQIKMEEDLFSNKNDELQNKRAAQEFEKLRFRIDQLKERPKAFMFTYGNVTMRRARALFACNFMACAGFEVIDNNGFANFEKGLKEFEKSNAHILVLCSADEEYLSIAEQIKGKLPLSKTVVVAGYPKETIEEIKKTGIDHFIHIRSNALEILKDLQSRIL